MRRLLFAALLVGIVACRPSKPPSSAVNPDDRAVANKEAGPRRPAFTLPKLRAEFKTKLSPPDVTQDRTPPDEPPADVFEKVMYPAPLGENFAYVSPVKPGVKRPAIVWIAGGFFWGIGDDAWRHPASSNDQTARQFREAGIVLMLPSLRGTHTNPGQRELLLGEVDDVLAAADFLAKREDVDPNRIYLGGHSTGGTMVLLAAESTARFRAVFSFGPVGNVRGYGEGWGTFDEKDEREWNIRSPLFYMDTIATPTFIIEGTQGNVGQFPYLRRRAKFAPVHFIPVLGPNHFNVLAPMNELIARKILADNGPRCDIEFTDNEVDEIAVNKVKWERE